MSATQNDRLLAYLDPDSMTIVTRDSLAAALVFLAPRDAPDAIRMNEEAIVRHAVPRIEEEAIATERARILAEVEALSEPGHLDWISRAAVIAAIKDVSETMTRMGETT